MKSINKSLLVLMLGASSLVVGCSNTDEIAQKEQQLTNQEQQLNAKQEQLGDKAVELRTKEQLLNEKQQNLANKEQELNEKAQALAEEEAAREAAAKKITYAVKEGDTLTEIANANNTTIEALVSLNPQLNDKGIDLLYVGDVLKLN
ncbi:LysM peptidoglycan-binding domain-containing protein [Vibrio hannami]|uniref:LysM peptidoglycan-binding domain-containing protein n=1 Tax=Vibrio hannami TaxID=2717094 RepID=UPI00240FE80C|nr:LysM peptidoglycan-binding domain-containing protein [Vibrio hannami]MDG3087511.1 LysM peptidoglycan-binding domain-containing protein [Vibrio hannami]